MRSLIVLSNGTSTKGNLSERFYTFYRTSTKKDFSHLFRHLSQAGISFLWRFFIYSLLKNIYRKFWQIILIIKSRQSKSPNIKWYKKRLALYKELSLIHISITAIFTVIKDYFCHMFTKMIRTHPYRAVNQFIKATHKVEQISSWRHH